MRPRTTTDIALGLWTLLVLVFLIEPILAILPISLSSESFLNYPLPGLSLKWFGVVLAGYPWLFALKNSLFIAAATVLVSVPLGTAAAYGLATKDFPGRPIVMGLLISPMVVPVVITGLASYFFLSGFGLQGTFTGMIVAHSALALPFVVIPVSATLKGYDPNLNRASASLGASPWTTFRSITLPLIASGVASGAVFAFITSFDEVTVALFISSPSSLTLPRQLFSGLRDQLTPALVAVAVILIVVSCVLMGGVELLRSRSARFAKHEVRGI